MYILAGRFKCLKKPYIAYLVLKNAFGGATHVVGVSFKNK